MKMNFPGLLTLCLSSLCALGQGYVDFVIIGEYRTRIGAADGPFAGDRYLGQLLAGNNENSLSPAGQLLAHLGDEENPSGIIVGGLAPVESVPIGESAIIQFAAWDGDAWGDNIQNVPEKYLGKTETISLRLDPNTLGGIPLPTRFPSGAIVPQIPEPRNYAQVTLGFLILFIWKLRAVRQRI